MTVASLFLLTNGFLYIALGLWCVIRPEETAEGIGLSWAATQGLVEYVTVSGGLVFGAGVFFLFGVLRSEYARAGVIFGVCLYACLAGFRSLALIIYGADIGTGYMSYAAEITMLVFALLAARLKKPPADTYAHSNRGSPKQQSHYDEDTQQIVI